MVRASMGALAEVLSCPSSDDEVPSRVSLRRWRSIGGANDTKGLGFAPEPNLVIGRGGNAGYASIAGIARLDVGDDWDLMAKRLAVLGCGVDQRASDESRRCGQTMGDGQRPAQGDRLFGASE